LGPDVNESNYKFTVNDRGAIRFGMGAVKGVGRGAVETIVENRSQGKYKSVFDLAKRIDLRAANKRAFENLAYAGGFDGFGAHRAQYLHKDQDGIVFLEKVLRYASKFQENENSAQVSLFGDMSEVQIPEPEVPPCEEWSTMRKLKLEKEVVGLYISGHPLDDYKHEMKFFTTAGLSELQDLEKMVKREVQIGGIVSETKHLESRNGTGFGIFVIEDYEDNFELRMYGEDYLKWRHLMVQNSFVHIRLTVREGWVDKRTGRKNDPSLQVMNVMLLQDVIDKQSKKITIKIPLSEVDEDRISFLRGLVMEYQGNKQLEFVVFEDSMPQTKITMPSRKYKVSISGKLLRSLEKKQLKYRLN